MSIEYNADTNKSYANQKCIELIAQVKEIREKNYLSQTKVASAMGLTSHSSLVSMENFHVIPRLDKFLALLSVYGYTLEIVKKDADL